jgi:hypothetical protein
MNGRALHQLTSMLAHFPRAQYLSPDIPKKVYVSDRIVRGFDGAHQSANLRKVSLAFDLELQLRQLLFDSRGRHADNPGVRWKMVRSMRVGFKIACLGPSSRGIDEFKSDDYTIAEIGFHRKRVFSIAVRASSVKVYLLDLIIRRL